MVIQNEISKFIITKKYKILNNNYLINSNIKNSFQCNIKNCLSKNKKNQKCIQIILLIINNKML